MRYQYATFRKTRLLYSSLFFLLFFSFNSLKSQTAVDIGVFGLAAPITSGCHSATETVTIVIKNFGTAPLNFTATPVTVSANTTGVNPVTFTPVVVSSGTLNAGATQNVNMAPAYNMTATGTHTFNASTSMSGDGNAANDNMNPVSILISGGTAVSAQSSICQGNTATVNVTAFTSGGTIQWQDSPDNIAWANITGANSSSVSVTPATTTFYRAVICGTNNSTSDTITVVSMSTPTTTGATRCGPGPVTLSAAGSGSLSWYTAPTGGSLVNTGTTYSPTVTATTNYYVSNATGGGSQNVGPASNAIGAGAQQASTNYNIFDVFTACQLQSVVVYPGASGSATLELVTSGNVLITSTPLTFTPAQVGTAVTVTLNWNLTPGTGFRLRRGGTVSLYRNSGGVSYPYTLPGYVSITGSAAGASYYYWAYNWTVATGCESPRTIVTATVNPSPAISAIAAAIVCAGDSASLSVSSSNTDYNYTWSPATGLNTTTGSSVLAGPSAPGNYTYFVDALDNNTQCANRDTVTFELRAGPVVTASVDNAAVCSGTQVNLAAAQPSPTIVVSSGTVTNTPTGYPAPYGNWFWGAKHQMLIRATELTAAGMTAGNINSLQFDVAAVNSCPPLQNFEIRMGATALNAMTTSFVSSLVSVTTPVTYTPTVGTNTHTFTTPFFWDGVSNIIVQTCFNNSSFLSAGNASMTQVATAFQSTLETHADNSTVCSNATGTLYSQRPNITFQRSFAAWTYAWTPAGAVSSPTALNTTATPFVTTDYIVTVTDTLSGCTADDTVTVSMLPSPDPDFGPDTSLCSNAIPLILDAGAGTFSYLWQDGSTNQTYSVTAPGFYNVTVTNTVSGCVGRDTLQLTFSAGPSFTLGADQTSCDGAPVTFSGPSGNYTYSWNTSATTQSISTGTAGTYILTVTDTQTGCSENDAVDLIVNPSPVVNLGNDTGFCSADLPFILNAPPGNFSYLWSDNSTGQTLTISAAGNYFVDVTDNINGCASRDSINIAVGNTPSFSLGNDTTFCTSSPFTLTAPAGYTYVWDNQATTQSISVTASGTYSVVVTDPASGCNSNDAIVLTAVPGPAVVLNDTSLCAASYTINAPVSSSYTYMWNTGATTSSITVSSGGSYTVTVTDTNTGCSASDATNVILNAPPAINFVMQSTACTTDPPVNLTATPSGGIFSGPGVSGNTFNPGMTGAGTFTVAYNYTDTNGCANSASNSIVVDPCVGITEQTLAGVSIYPNPNDGIFTLVIGDNSGDVEVEITNAQGQLVFADKVSASAGSYIRQIDLRAEANGIYFVRIQANGLTSMKKVVKQQ